MANDVGTTILAVTQGMTSYLQFLPPLREVRKADLDDPDMRGDVRFGELAATGVTLGTGAILSSLVNSKAPFLISMLVSFGFICLYETALRKNRPMEFTTLLRNKVKEMSDE